MSQRGRLSARVSGLPRNGLSPARSYNQLDLSPESETAAQERKHRGKFAMRLRIHQLCAVVAFAGAHRASLAGTPTVIFSNIQSSPTANVPGIPELKFGATQHVFDPPAVSPDGEHWVFRAVAIGGDLVVVGGGTDGTTASVVVRRNAPTFFDSGINYTTVRPDTAIRAITADTNRDGSVDFFDTCP
jgi:hypothetical protein